MVVGMAGRRAKAGQLVGARWRAGAGWHGQKAVLILPASEEPTDPESQAPAAALLATTATNRIWTQSEIDVL